MGRGEWGMWLVEEGYQWAEGSGACGLLRGDISGQRGVEWACGLWQWEVDIHVSR